MVNFKFYDTKRKFTAYVLVGTMFASAIGLTGCNKNNTENNYNVSNSQIQSVVDDTKEKIDTYIPELSDEVTNNTSILLLLDIIAAKNENGKINPELMSKLKAKIDSDNMLIDFDTFLDVLQQKMIEDKKIIRVSEALPDTLETDKVMLSSIELLLSNIIKYSEAKNKEQVIDEFNKLYLLFIKGMNIKVNGREFKVNDMDYASRAVANTYAETAIYYARSYITTEQYSNMDNILDDQNNKGYTKTVLEILSNQIEEKSTVNVISIFNNKYSEISKFLNGKVDLTEDTIKNLVNYINMKYLNSDKVSTKDKNEIFGEYGNAKINDVILAIDAINEYNLKNQNNIIPFSVLLIDEHLKTETGKTDKIALDFVQFNTIMLVNTKESATTNERLRNNPYFENVFKYFTKDNFTHSEQNNSTNIIWQEISDGTNFVNNEVILYTLNKLSEVENLNNYKEKAQMNLAETIRDLQNVIERECKTTDYDQFVKTR